MTNDQRLDIGFAPFTKDRQELILSWAWVDTPTLWPEASWILMAGKGPLKSTGFLILEHQIRVYINGASTKSLIFHQDFP